MNRPIKALAETLELNAHLTCAQLFENGEITEVAWDRALYIHRTTGRALLEVLVEISALDPSRLRAVCPNWVDGPAAVPGTATEDMLRSHPSPFKAD